MLLLLQKPLLCGSRKICEREKATSKSERKSFPSTANAAAAEGHDSPRNEVNTRSPFLSGKFVGESVSSLRQRRRQIRPERPPPPPLRPNPRQIARRNDDAKNEFDGILRKKPIPPLSLLFYPLLFSGKKSFNSSFFFSLVAGETAVGSHLPSPLNPKRSLISTFWSICIARVGKEEGSGGGLEDNFD